MLLCARLWKTQKPEKFATTNIPRGCDNNDRYVVVGADGGAAIDDGDDEKHDGSRANSRYEHLRSWSVSRHFLTPQLIEASLPSDAARFAFRSERARLLQQSVKLELIAPPGRGSGAGSGDFVDGRPRAESDTRTMYEQSAFLYTTNHVYFQINRALECKAKIRMNEFSFCFLTFFFAFAFLLFSIFTL